MKKKVIIIFMLILITASVVGVGVYVKHIQNIKTSRAEELRIEEKKETYLNNIKSCNLTFISEVSGMKLMWDWRGFEENLIKKRIEGKSKFDDMMKELQNPPKEYKELYEYMLKAYNVYSTMYTMSTDYGMYTNKKENQSKFEKLYLDFINIKDNIKIRIPKSEND